MVGGQVVPPVTSAFLIYYPVDVKTGGYRVPVDVSAFLKHGDVDDLVVLAAAVEAELEARGVKDCGCGAAYQVALHSCPYDEELGEGKSRCTCCSACQSGCARDI